jgi:1A family penicillin-binding protein
MSKAKRKPRKSRRPVFYESVSVMPVSSVGLPQVTGQWRDTLQVLAEIGRAVGKHLRLVVGETFVNMQHAGRATYETIAQISKEATLAAHYGFDATLTYVPAIATDTTVFAGRTVYRLFNRRARAFYLILAATAAFAGVIVISITAASTLKSYASDISSPSALLAKKKIGTTILDRNGQVLFQGYGAQSNIVLGLNEIPKSLKDATLAAEDPGFYEHPGISIQGTLRAAITDITHQRTVEGGSTLTQQLIKNSLLTSDKNFQRKYQEILLAIELERHYSKDEILQMYLNETFYGEGSSGVAAASQTYFHKTASMLTLGESALLAGLPLGPSRLDPNFDLTAATGRRDYVLGRMVQYKKITSQQADAAKAQPLALASNPTASPSSLKIYPKTITIRAPHFVFYVLDQLRAKYGDDLLQNGGITVKTTLDLTKQDLAQQTVTTQINKLSEHHVTNGGLVSIDPRTGDVIAMVGSTDYNAPDFGNVNVTLSDLQPGSSFKPIAYATAFKKGWTGATTILDAPFSAPGGNGTIYAPQNYDLKFHGTITLRHALDNSLNIPAVKVLQFAGVPDTLQTAHDLGITTLTDANRYGLALVLGGGEVRPIDMATVYATFDNNGVKIEPRSILQVADRYGKDITKPDQQTPKTVIDPRIAYMITSIISDDKSRQPEFPANGPLTLSGRPAAAKTGTTNDFRDNWTVGYTPQLVTAVWVGNNDHSPMSNVDGITGAAPIWHDYMEGALAGEPAIAFTPPAGITAASVCASNGGLANPGDTSAYTEIFMSEALPTKHCSNPAPTPPPTPTPDTTPVIDPNAPGNQNPHKFMPPTPITN